LLFFCHWISECGSTKSVAANRDGQRSPGVAQPVLYEDFAVRRVNRVELLTVGADCRLVSVALVGGHL
jgi:hypothetical protein